MRVFRGIHDAMNTGDLELISKTIDEVVEPNVLFYPPVPTGATGRRHSSRVAGTPSRVPGPHVEMEDLIEEGDTVVARDTVTGPTRASTGASRQPAPG